MINFEKITLNVHRQILLSGVSLQINEGDKVVIRGPSGCGKSSLIKAVVGALPPAGGSIKVAGLEMNAGNVAQIRARIAYIGQEPVLGADNAGDALLLPFQYKVHKGNKPSKEKITQTLEQLHLSTDILDKPAKRISGGEKQRIAIARAILLNKTVFLADEITSALDPESKAAVMEQLFKPGITMLSVSHDPDWISACSRKLEIAEGKLIEGVAAPKIGNQQSATEMTAEEAQSDR